MNYAIDDNHIRQLNQFILKKAKKLNSGYPYEQILEEVRTHVFSQYIGIAKIDVIIGMCMCIYAEIVHKSHALKDNQEMNNESFHTLTED